MSSKNLHDVADFGARRAKRSREAATKLLDAAVESLRERAFDAITIHAVADRAEVSGATAAKLFATEADLIVEACLRRIRGVALSTDAMHGSITRVTTQLSHMMLVVAEEPALAAACAAVFLDRGPAADRARELIGLEIHRLIASAVGPGAWPEVITTLELVFSGALIQAAAGATTFQRGRRAGRNLGRSHSRGRSPSLTNGTANDRPPGRTHVTRPAMIGIDGQRETSNDLSRHGVRDVDAVTWTGWRAIITVHSGTGS